MFQRDQNKLSTLKGNAAQVAKRKAPPAAEKTEKSKGAFTPRAAVIVTPNKIRRNPLSTAAARVCQPIIRPTPSRASAEVAIIARAGIIALGKNQLSVPVYETNRAKLPQLTLGCPKVPHHPNRSATAERKENPRASRKNKETYGKDCIVSPFSFFLSPTSVPLKEIGSLLAGGCSKAFVLTHRALVETRSMPIDELPTAAQRARSLRTIQNNRLRRIVKLRHRDALGKKNHETRFCICLEASSTGLSMAFCRPAPTTRTSDEHRGF